MYAMNKLIQFSLTLDSFQFFVMLMTTESEVQCSNHAMTTLKTQYSSQREYKIELDTSDYVPETKIYITPNIFQYDNSSLKFLW